MSKIFEILKNVVLGGIILSGIVIIYLWVTADRCYYAIKKHRR